MNNKLLLALYLLLTSSITFASTGVQYALINTSASVIPDPIHITGGYITYTFSDTIQGDCPAWDNPVRVDLSTITQIPLPISQKNESLFTFNIPANMQHCFTEHNWATAELVITQVDGVNKKYGTCSVYTSIIFSNEISYTNLEIIKTADNFYCKPVNY